MVTRTQRTPFGLFQTSSSCRKCHGEGKILEDPCEKCDGAGRVEAERKIKVDIPAGVDTGTTLRLTNQGEAGEKGARGGDLYVVIHVTPHDVFERKGNNLFIETPLSFFTAVMGGTVEVPTIDGTAKLKIPAGTKSNTMFKMHDKGVPYLNSSSRGDQYVKTVIFVPENLNAKQKAALKEFADTMGEKLSPQKSFIDKVKEKFV
jgi:molecular chaperone DnaJ